ncbi:MAG: class I SAM-dependent methyltransferase [Myxococcota bacterium]
MKLRDIVPWGRSQTEYRSMFNLSDADLGGTLLGCGDGPASFNAEITASGGRVVSVDPIYRFDATQLRGRIEAAYEEVMPQVIARPDEYSWKSIRDPDELGRVRMRAMETFLGDYERGKAQERYIEGALPELPFADERFDLALCSHFLFLYSERVSLEQHLASVRELCRVAKEARIYPLLTLAGEPSPHVDPLRGILNDTGIDTRLVTVEYEFQKGATQMLVARA